MLRRVLMSRMALSLSQTFIINCSAVLRTNLRGVVYNLSILFFNADFDVHNIFFKAQDEHQSLCRRKVLFVSVSSLRCLTCTSEDWASCLGNETTCDASVTSCVSAISTVLTGGGKRVTKVFRSCYPTALCDKPVSFNVTTSSGHVSLKCCQTDSCNTEHVTASEDRPLAKLECYGSFGVKPKCRSKVKCSASEDSK